MRVNYYTSLYTVRSINIFTLKIVHIEAMHLAMYITISIKALSQLITAVAIFVINTCVCVFSYIAVCSYSVAASPLILQILQSGMH